MFSVLMSVYSKDNPVYFHQALASLIPQTRYISEVVLVKDGQIGRNLQNVIDAFSVSLPIKEVQLLENVGLARALNAGLEHCKSEWIFRFDADDLCVPDRARLQWDMIAANEIDILGGQIEECTPDTLQPLGVRTVPCKSNDIRHFLKRRNPFNHMTVCFKKSFIESIGKYPTIPLKEDYALWAKAVAAGARVANLPQILVRARAGSAMIARRGGIEYALSEIELQWFLRRHGLKSIFSAIADGLFRAAVFVAPRSFRKFVFHKFLRG